MGQLLQQPAVSWQGQLRAMRARIGYADDGVPYVLPTLRAGTHLHHIHRKVTETFDDSGTDELSIGTSGDPDAFNKPADTDLTAADDYTATTGDDGYPFQLAADTAIELLYEGQNGDATQGSVDVTVVYAPCEV